MSKEELIKLLETLDFEELRCATISYYKKKPKKSTLYYEETEDYNPKTICIGTNLESLINENYENLNWKINELGRKILGDKDNENN